MGQRGPPRDPQPHGIRWDTTDRFTTGGETAVTPAAGTGSEGAASAVLIRKVAVLGAGSMGSRIAAHLANAEQPNVVTPALIAHLEQS